MSLPVRLRVTFAWLMSGLMSLLMTGWIGWINAGISADFLARWAHAFVLAWPAAFTIVLIAAANSLSVIRVSYGGLLTYKS